MSQISDLGLKCFKGEAQLMISHQRNVVSCRFFPIKYGYQINIL